MVHSHTLCYNLSEVVYMIVSLQDIVSTYIFRNIYVTKFQSVLRYSIIFWGGEGNSRTAFTLHKRVLRTIKAINNWVSCRQIFNEFKILTVNLLYIFEVLCYIKQNNIYQTQNLKNYNTSRKAICISNHVTLHVAKKKCSKYGIILYNKLLVGIMRTEF